MISDMTEGNPLKHILLFSIPLLIGNIFQQLYNISDLVIVGRILGTNAFAAVGATAPLFFLITFIIIGLTNGFAVVTGQRFGAKDFQGVKNSVVVSVILGSVVTIFFTIICSLLLHPTLHAMNIPKSIYHDAYWYTEIIFLGLIITTTYNMLASIIRALGDSKTPLYFLIISSIANIFLALLFIRQFHLGVAGSAVAVILSQALSVILCLIFVKYKFPILNLSKQDWKIKFNRDFFISATEHLRVGLPMAIQFSIIGISILIIQSVCNSFGEDVIVSFSAAMRIEQFATTPLLSFAVALTTFVAQNYGAKNFKRIKQGVNITSVVNIVISLAVAVIMRFYGAEIAGAIIGSATDKIIKIAHEYLIISTIFYLFIGQMFIYRNALQGMGATIFPLLASTLELFIRMFAAIYLSIKMGYTGIFYAGPIAWTGAAIVVSVGYFATFKSIAYKALKNEKNL